MSVWIIDTRDLPLIHLLPLTLIEVKDQGRNPVSVVLVIFEIACVTFDLNRIKRSRFNTFEIVNHSTTKILKVVKFLNYISLSIIVSNDCPISISSSVEIFILYIFVLCLVSKVTHVTGLSLRFYLMYISVWFYYFSFNFYCCYTIQF